MNDTHHQVVDARETALVSEILRDSAFLDEFPQFNPNDFRNELWALVAATAHRQHLAGQSPDMVSVVAELDRGGALGEKCGPDAVPSIIALAQYPLTSNPLALLCEIHEEANRRRLLFELELLKTAATDPTITTATLSRRLSDAASKIGPVASESRFRFMTARELSEADLRTEFIVRGISAAGLTGGIFGPSKGMKTSLMVAFAHSVASGTPFLGTFEVVRPRPVLMMSSESGLATIRNILARISEWSHCDYRDLPITLSDEVPTLTDPRDIAAVERQIDKSGAELALLDPWYHMCGDAASDMANQLVIGRVLKEMPALGKRTGATIKYAHHLRKVTPIGEPTGLPDIQGSGHDAHVRQWWCINRRSVFDPESGRAELWLNIGSSLGFSRLLAVDIDEGVMRDDGTGRFWSVTVNEPSAARRTASTDRQKKRETEKWQTAQATRRVRIDKLLAAYRARPDGDTKTTIKGLAGFSATVFDDVNSDLLRCGAVVTEERQKHTRTETFFRLADGWDLKVSQLSAYTPGDSHAAV